MRWRSLQWPLFYIPPDCGCTARSLAVDTTPEDPWGGIRLEKLVGQRSQDPHIKCLIARLMPSRCLIKVRGFLVKVFSHVTGRVNGVEELANIFFEFKTGRQVQVLRFCNTPRRTHCDWPQNLTWSPSEIQYRPKGEIALGKRHPRGARRPQRRAQDRPALPPLLRGNRPEAKGEGSTAPLDPSWIKRPQHIRPSWPWILRWPHVVGNDVPSKVDIQSRNGGLYSHTQNCISAGDQRPDKGRPAVPIDCLKGRQRSDLWRKYSLQQKIISLPTTNAWEQG